MSGLLSKIHWIILIYVGFNVYVGWADHQDLLVANSQQIPIVKNRIKKVKKERKQLLKYFKDVNEAKDKIEEVAKEVEILQRKLPRTDKSTEDFQTIKRFANELRISNIYLSPLSENAVDFYISKRYEFKASGTYLQFLILLEKIANNERILNIRELSLTNSNKKQRGRFQIINFRAVLESYRHNPNFREERGIDKIETSFKGKNKIRNKGKRKKRSRKRNKK